MFSQPDVTIHTPIESPSQVDQKYVVIENVYCVFWPKKPKNSVKIHLLRGRFEKKGFVLKISKKRPFLKKKKAKYNFAVHFLQNELLKITFELVFTLL